MTEGSMENTGAHARDVNDNEVRYPENRVVGLLATTEQLESAVGALTSGGFLASEKLRANTGRSGLAHLAMRFAESIGMPNDETAIKNQYADELGSGQLLLTVLAPREERRNAD